MNLRKSAHRPVTPWHSVKSSELVEIRGVCFDIDDTLSTHGKLTSDAYASLWALNDAGFRLVAITGRPAGWCDHFARFWPVDGVVGENGAFSFYMSGSRRERINTPGGPVRHLESPVGLRAPELAHLAMKIKSRFPDAKWASDQNYREYDLAIDFCEDVKCWPAPRVEALLDMCKKEGAHAKLSSIHVNSWFGDYDKFKGFLSFLNSAQIKRLPPAHQWIFIGDSPNDEPVFAQFQYSVGVANLKPFLNRITSPPRWITKSDSGTGFTEVAKKLILGRRLRRTR